MGTKKRQGNQNNVVKESKGERFVRVVKPRVNKAVKAISVIGYCSGSAYEYTPQQVSQILATLSGALSALSSKFESKSKKQEEFDFS